MEIYIWIFFWVKVGNLVQCELGGLYKVVVDDVDVIREVIRFYNQEYVVVFV